MLSKLIPLTLLRGSSGINYLRTDPVRANPVFHKVKNRAFKDIEKKVLMKIPSATGAGAGGAQHAAHPTERRAAQVEAAKKQRADTRLVAAAGAGQGSSAATAGRGNTSNAQDASRGCSGAGGRRGSRHTAPDSDTADEDSGDNDFSDDDDENDEVEAAGALTSIRAAGQAAAAGGRGPMKRKQQKKKQKATAKRARVVAPPTLPEQPGAPRLSSSETRPNPKYTD
ncbi:hypothetical protein COO60DRAFT_311378 [Scenedesmus sp. NREL 46B-D3]|nr:hypothetical protein COO60DRAFT_311378 [Scenedesmus sp. NREL 46B-D3]